MESVMYPRSRSKAVYKRQTSVGGPVASIFIKGNVGQKGSTYMNQETILSYKSFAQIWNIYFLLNSPMLLKRSLDTRISIKNFAYFGYKLQIAAK